MALRFDLNRATRAVLWVALGLFFLNGVLGVLQFVGHESALTTILDYFDTGFEGTMPTWFSSLLLAAGSVGSFLAARAVEGRNSKGFIGLGVLMAYLSMDEATELHEQLTTPLRDGFNLDGIWYWSWVIVGMLAVVLVGALFIPFLRRIPRPVSAGLIVAGAVYVISAVGFEMIGSYFFSQTLSASVFTSIPSMLEELGEMSGAILLARVTFLVAEHGLSGVDSRMIYRDVFRREHGPIAPSGPRARI